MSYNGEGVNRRQFLDEDLLKNNKNGAQAEADTVDS